jgi:hypothetical protein
MKRYSANPVKTLCGIDSYATSQDQFVPEHYMHYNSDTVAAHSVITGIADVALRYNTICSGCHIYQTRPSKSLLNRWEGQGSLNLKKIDRFRPMLVFVGQYL